MRRFTPLYSIQQPRVLFHHAQNISPRNGTSLLLFQRWLSDNHRIDRARVDSVDSNIVQACCPDSDQIQGVVFVVRNMTRGGIVGFSMRRGNTSALQALAADTSVTVFHGQSASLHVFHHFHRHDWANTRGVVASKDHRMSRILTSLHYQKWVRHLLEPCISDIKCCDLGLPVVVWRCGLYDENEKTSCCGTGGKVRKTHFASRHRSDRYMSPEDFLPPQNFNPTDISFPYYDIQASRIVFFLCWRWGDFFWYNPPPPQYLALFIIINHNFTSWHYNQSYLKLCCLARSSFSRHVPCSGPARTPCVLFPQSMSHLSWNLPGRLVHFHSTKLTLNSRSLQMKISRRWRLRWHPSHVLSGICRLLSSNLLETLWEAHVSFSYTSLISITMISFRKISELVASNFFSVSSGDALGVDMVLACLP